MKGRAALERFLTTDPRDAGCRMTIEELHVYAELALRDEAAARRARPDLAAHLDACGPCAEDLAGLLAALRG
jgi:hypothetical protein